ncbi:DUF1826 domain-containing protein [Cognaticolwellia aestuarii]|mgnify:CR=1 FL=1|jgi:hypothetical protein|uniref:DUF1826 domain-containing protein n=1 Tax=Cognaticolwellia aestuarii TaxID=329993 RepID=UPI00098620BD|nr:DUF1826 domain-containing protein [Cognaticolwellia aestuarii]
MSSAARKEEQCFSEIKINRAVQGDTPDVLTDIYQENTNIVTWQRDLSQALRSAIDDFLKCHKTKATVLAVTPENTQDTLIEAFGEAEIKPALRDDIALLVDMFCCLFDLKGAGLRISVLERAMCPRFHVDKIPCRLVTTYRGVATDWLHHDVIDREKLGAGHQGKPDEQSGLFKNLNDINQLTQGDVALLKGEGWYNNNGAGLVHRSPPVAEGERRLLLTLDFLSD